MYENTVCCICGKFATCHVEYNELKHYCIDHYHLSVHPSREKENDSYV